MDVSLHDRFSDNLIARETAEAIEACVHCGFCLATCPTYLEARDERDSPRGRIYLIRDLLQTGESDASAQYHIDRCLTCRSCESTCPSGVAYGEKGYWMWHPGREEILYHEASPSGQVRMGTTHFSDANTFITLTEAVRRTGETVPNRGENIILTDDSHRTTAFGLDENGEWVEQNGLTWTREPVEGGPQRE